MSVAVQRGPAPLGTGRCRTLGYARNRHVPAGKEGW